MTQGPLTDRDLENLLERLKADLPEFPEGANTLDVQLESAAKHIPAYIKIVKSHITQLAEVLELENHNHRTLDSAELAEPVNQLIKIFKQLEDQDIHTLEALSTCARSYQPQAIAAADTDNANSAPSEAEAS